MRVLLTSEARFERTPDGVIWAPAAYGRPLWARYLEVFSSVVVAARVADVLEPSPGSLEASSATVRFCRLPSYSGLAGVVRHARAIYRAIVDAARECPAVIVRSPSPTACITATIAAGAGRPYAAEIVGDPNAVFSPGAVRHPLRVLLRCTATAAQQYVSRHAIAALYVTRHALQRRYPTRGRVYAASDVTLDDFAFGPAPLRDWRPPAPFVIVTVGALDRPYKGTAVLIDAISVLRKRHAPVALRIVGEGRLKAQLQERCRTLGVADRVEFLGQQDRAGVLAALDAAHLFVLPSLTEGLPRALVEAMARGLPAVGTTVGGVPELLDAACLVPPRQPRALAARIEELMADGSRRQDLGERNRQLARTYHERVQGAVRREFLHAVMDASAPGFREARCA